MKKLKLLAKNAVAKLLAHEAPSNSTVRINQVHFKLVKGHKGRISHLYSTYRKLSRYQCRLHQALETNNFPPHLCHVPPNPPPLPMGQRHSTETLEAYIAAAKKANHSLAKVLYKRDEAIRGINGTITNQAEKNQAIALLHSHLDSAK